MSLATHQNASKHSLLSMLVLVLTLVQGTSTTLTLVYHYSPPLEPLISMLWASTYMLALIGLIANFGINWLTWLIRYRLLLSVLLIGTALSAVWSYDLGLTVERTVHLFGSTLIAFYIGFTIPLTRIVNTTALVLGLLMLCSVGAALGMPALGIENYEGRDVWRGIMTSKNTLGFWSAITILACAVAFGNTQTVVKKLLLIAGIALAAIALFNSVSATSLLSLIVSALVMTYLYVAFRFDLGLVSTLVLGVFAAGLAGLAFYNIDTAELIGRSGDLTGRGDVWNQVWKLILDKPLTGYGYGTIWYPTEESVWIQQALTDFSWKVFHAHNGLLQLASEIGIPLTFIAVIMIIQQLIEIVYCQYQRQQAGVLFVLGFTVALLVSNYSEARLVVNRELYWIFFVALPISMLQQVHVIAAGARFNPMPAPLHKRTRGKIQSNASDREYRRKLKRRLNDRLQLHDGGKKQISADGTSENPSSIASHQAKLDKPNDQQKKTGS